MERSMHHVPVLHETVLRTLSPQLGETVLDVTLGLGGHAAAMLHALGSAGVFIGIDADERNLAWAKEHLKAYEGQTQFHHCNFSQIGTLGLPPLDIVFADLGLSSPHIDDPERGFSFRLASPLDLRFDQHTGRTATQCILESSPEELRTVFREYGELWQEGGKLARVCAGKDLRTTLQLKELVEASFGYRAKSILPQVFQALRIAVNDELGALKTLLTEAPMMLSSGGRMGVISYHSLEDRLVKQKFRELTTPEKDPVTGKIAVEALFVPITKKPIVATAEEIAENPRARSAKFRVIRRL